MTVKSSISLTDQQAAFARRLVEEGRYSSVSAVVQQGLEVMRAQDETREAELEVMRAFFRQRMAEPTISEEEFQVRVEEMLRDKRGLHDLVD